jgi:heme/copper-type cytochrome/quinol oxidase subunit 1
MIAAVTLAFMAVFYQVMLPRLGRPLPPSHWQRRQIHLFAWGQLLACVGLFIAGGHGAPRKVAGSSQGLEGLIPVLGLGMNGLGGLVAVIGGGIFVVLMVQALLRPATAENAPTGTASAL